MTADEQPVLTLLRSPLGCQPGEGGSIEQARCPACKGDGRAEAVSAARAAAFPNSLASRSLAEPVLHISLE
jgi:hypothetical protein